MKRKLAVLAALIALAACALSGAALAAVVGSELQTEISIQFEESIYFARMQGEGGMDINFGIQPLPLPGVTWFIPAPDGSHTIRVSDGRVQAGGWTVHTIMPQFTSGAETWMTNGLRLFNTAATDGVTPTLQSAQLPPWPPGQYVHIHSADTLIMTAAAGLKQGNYDLTWAGEDTYLYVGSGQAVAAKPLAYKSTITWTLQLTPP